MNLVYCRLETADNNTKDFNFESKTKILKEDYDLIFKSYLYMIYYFSTTSEMSNQDLEFYDLFSPPFVKAVFIFKINNDFFKLNYTDLPLSYQLSTFYPETGKSNIISSQPRDIYNRLTNDFMIDSWDKYKLIYNLIPNEEKEELSDGELSLSLSSYGDDYTNSYDDENSLSLGSSSVSYEEEEEQGQVIRNNFDELSIKGKRNLLEKYKKELEDALKIKTIKKSIKDINVKLKFYSKIKKEIENFNIVIKDKEEKRKSFVDIHWMSENLFIQMTSYVIKKKKFNDDIIAYNEKLDKNKEDIASIKPDNIFKNKIVIPTFIVSVITFILSWVMREDFWYLSGVAIPFITLSFYFLWGYIDYLEYIIKLKREKTFYEKKIVKRSKTFKENFGNLETIMKKEKIEDIDIPIQRFQELKEFDLELEDLHEKQQMFIAKNFSADAQSEFQALIEEKEELNTSLKEFKDLSLNNIEIEYNIIELKKSIKEYEKKELDEFSLDDDEEEDLGEDELTLDLSTHNEEIKEYEFKYELEVLKNYFRELKEYFQEDLPQIYKQVKKDFLEILDLHVHYKFSLDFDIENENFILSSEKEIELDREYENKIKFFLQYALIIHISKEKQSPVFINIPEINKTYAIHFTSFLENMPKAHIIYTE